MRTSVAILLLAATLPATAAEPVATAKPPLSCPQCGTWELGRGSFGVAGDHIRIEPKRVEIPSQGSFCVTALKHSVEPDGPATYRYKTTLDLSDGDDDCAVTGPATLRMEMVINGYFRDASMAGFEAFKPGTSSAVFSATGWNYARENPCEVGSLYAFIACATIAHARAYKALALVTYEASRHTGRNGPSAFERSFNPNRYAHEVKAFCDRRAEGRSGGHAYWSMSCQNERIRAKLKDIVEWRACVAARKRPCKVPGYQFDRSSGEDSE